jgi:hypothetical protein
MASYKKKVDFLQSPEADKFKQALVDMTNSDKYNTAPSYAKESEINPDCIISFIDKHMQYMCDHPSTDTRHYLANLKLMTRIQQVK